MNYSRLVDFIFRENRAWTCSQQLMWFSHVSLSLYIGMTMSHDTWLCHIYNNRSLIVCYPGQAVGWCCILNKPQKSKWSGSDIYVSLNGQEGSKSPNVWSASYWFVKRSIQFVFILSWKNIYINLFKNRHIAQIVPFQGTIFSE